MAKRYFVEDLHLLSFASLSWRTPERVNLRLKRSFIQRLLTDPEAETSSYEKGVDGIDIANAAKIWKTVLLAPHIVEAIVEGRADDRVMLKVLEGTLPVDWGGAVGDPVDLADRKS